MKSLKINIFIISLIGLLCLSCGVVEKLANRVPVIKDIQASRYTILVGDTVTVSVTAEDPDDDDLIYSWSANSGSFDKRNQASVVWKAPLIEDIYNIQVVVKDSNEGEATENMDITVISNSEPNVKITNPVDGDFLVATQSVEVRSEATPVAYIDRVEFFINDQLTATDTTPPYMFVWQPRDYSGTVEIKSVAFRSIPSNIKAADSISVSIQGVVPIP